MKLSLISRHSMRLLELAAIIPTGADVARRGRPALPALCGPRRQGRRGQGHVPLGADSSV
jgi:hypothetical protein